MGHGTVLPADLTARKPCSDCLGMYLTEPAAVSTPTSEPDLDLPCVHSVLVYLNSWGMGVATAIPTAVSS
jgi:hypothetical protein